MKKQSKKLLSGVKPTARPHIGNYLGAMKQFVDLQTSYDTRIFIADLHAINSVFQPDRLRQLSWDIAVDFLAIGLDPDKVRIYKQSDIHQHAELQSILNNVVPTAYLLRAHAYKDAVAKGREVNAGVFNYPVLMAADIILYDTDVVPVGNDQKQHVEYARDFAERFNNRYGEVFTLPEPLIVEDVGVVPGLDGKKMSKSYHNYINLTADREEIRQAVMSIPTDSQPVQQPKVDYENDIVYRFHTYVTPADDLTAIKEGYEKGGLSYKESKERLINSLDTFLKPIREKRSRLEQETKKITEILEHGRQQAQEEAQAKLEKVKEMVGLV